MTLKTTYTCPLSKEPELLLEGATLISLSYRYELETSSEAAVAAALERVQASMLETVAGRSGLIDCDGPSVHHPWRRRRLSDGGESAEEGARTGRRRRLRAGGRGSNTIVGLGSDPSDEISDAPCRGDGADATSAGSDPFDVEDREVTPGLAGSVVIGEELDESDAAAEDDKSYADNEGMDVSLALFSTRIDGGEVVAHESVQRADSDLRDVDGRELDEEEDGPGAGGGRDSNDNHMDLLAFNYVSTQSLPVERSSHTSHNPLTPPAVFQQGSRMNDRPATGSELPPSTLVIQPRASRKCTVVEGRMSVYTTASEAEAAYENLEGRILAALTEDVNSNVADYTDDMVLGVRMYDDGAVPKDPISGSPGYVGAIKDGLPNTQDDGGGFVFTAPMAVLAALGCLLIALVALFVHTSNSKPRKRPSGNDSWHGSKASNGTYHDEEVEMDVKTAEKDLSLMRTFDEDDDDPSMEDYSVDQFSVSSARDTVCTNKLSGAKSLGSRSKSGGAPSSGPSSAASSKKRSVAEYSIVEEDVADRTATITQDLERSSLEADGTAPPPVWSSALGLFAARPRAASPDTEEVELDVTSVYDCDDGVESVSRVAGVAGASASRSLAPVAEEGRKSNATRAKSPFAGLLSMSRAKGRDEDEGMASNDAPAPSEKTSVDESTDSKKGSEKAAKSGAPDDDKARSLRFFSARERRASPHSEVEASLHPFEECSEYSTSVAGGRRGGRSVGSNYFFGGTADDDRIVLSKEEADGSRARVVRKFNKMINRKSTGDEDDGDALEIHQIYSHDEDRAGSKKRARGKRGGEGSTAVYTMQKAPSTLHPAGFYKSPSALSARTNSQLSQDPRNTSSVEASYDNERGYYVVVDDGSVSVENHGGLVCTGADDCWVPECLR